MKHERKQHSGVSAYFALCQDCKITGGVGKHLVMIHNGYGEEATDITQADMEAVHILAEKHEKDTKHEVIVYHYSV